MLKVNFEEIFLSMNPDLLILYFGINFDSREARIAYTLMKRQVEAAPYIETREELWAAMRLRWTPPWMIKGFVGLTRARTFMALLVALDLLKGASVLQGQVIPPPSGEAEKMKSMMDSVKAFSLEETPEEIIELCAEAGIDVVLVPEIARRDVARGRGASHGYYEVFQELARRHAGEGVYYHDLLDAFTPQRTEAYLTDEVHMNNEGFLFFTERIARFLLDEGIVSPPQVDAGL